MERLPRGWIPCIMLGHSLLRDKEADIKEEILIRAGDSIVDPDDYRVEWITISTLSEKAQTMAYCILAQLEKHDHVTKLYDMLLPVQDEELLVTNAYQPFIIPYPQTMATEQEVSQAIARHQEYTRSLVHITIGGILPTVPFTFIAAETGMIGSAEDSCLNTLAHNLMYGSITSADKVVLDSPIIRLTSDSKGTRLQLYGLRTEAEDLVKFGRELFKRVPRWFEEHNDRATLDTSDATRIIQQTAPSTGQPAQILPAALLPPSAAVTTQPPGHAEESPIMENDETDTSLDSVTVSRQQFDTAVQLLRTLTSQMGQVLQALTSVPTLVEHRQVSEDVISTISHMITQSSETTSAQHQRAAEDTSQLLTWIEKAQQVLTISVESGNNGATILQSVSELMALVTDLRNNTKAGNASHVVDTETATMTTAVETETTTRMSTLEEASATDLEGRPDTTTEHVADATAPAGPGDGQTETAPPDHTTITTDTGQTRANGLEARPENHLEDDESDTIIGSPSHLPSTDSTITATEAGKTSDYGGGPPSPTTTPTYPATNCHTCNVLMEDREICDHCEIPNHIDCMLQVPGDSNTRYCQTCHTEQYGEYTFDPQAAEGWDLSESSDSGSESSEFAPPESELAAQLPQSEQSLSSTPTLRMKLRDRNRK